jgi:hypothetical protein
MLRTLSTLTIAAAVGGGGAAAAAEAPHIHAPNAPSVSVKSITAPKAASAVKSIAGLKVDAPTVSAPEAPQLDLRPVDCTGTTCSADDPTDMAGTVVSFSGTDLTERTNSGDTYTAAVDDKTNIACPTQQAIDAGNVFNPVEPSIPTIGDGQVSGLAKPQVTDKYACSASKITAGRQIAGAELGRDSSGQLHWIALALAPN